MKKIKYFTLSLGIMQLISSCFTGKSQKVNISNNDSSQLLKKSFYDLTIKSLGEKELIKMENFKGKKVLIVNVASECGYTPQYAQLQQLQDSLGDKVTIIGCPCNQFGGQEPGTETEIQSFCKKNYGVSFLLTEKIDVKGNHQHPLYTWLCSKSLNNANDFEVKWNFNKFLIDENGNLIYYFGSSVSPISNDFIKIIRE